MTRALLSMMFLSFAARASPPEELGDPIKYLHQSVYDFTPERRAEWEASRFTANGILLNLGSVTTKEFDAVERGQVNVAFTDWLDLHADLRNDRDRQGSVQRLVIDLLAQVKPGLWFGVSGSPAARKEQYSLGGSLLFASPDRAHYALLRLVADQFLYNQLNLEGGTRASPVLHAQAEARFTAGALSLYGLVDLTTLGDISFTSELVSRRVSQRSEGQLHARFTTPALEVDGRLDVAMLRDESVQLALHSGLRRTLTTLRAQALVAPEALLGSGEPPGNFRLRFELRGAAEEAIGDDEGLPYRYSRLEPGMRAGLFWRGQEHQAEVGYAWAAASQQLAGDAADYDARTWQDKAYGFYEYSFSDRVHLRVLAAWEFANHHFGGGNGSFVALF